MLPAIWDTIKRSEPQRVPHWICELQPSELTKLVAEQKISCETKTLDASYIHFLEEQLALGVRGTELFFGTPEIRAC
jgi:hypothetical protein